MRSIEKIFGRESANDFAKKAKKDFRILLWRI